MAGGGSSDRAAAAAAPNPQIGAALGASAPPVSALSALAAMADGSQSMTELPARRGIRSMHGRRLPTQYESCEREVWKQREL